MPVGLDADSHWRHGMSRTDLAQFPSQTDTIEVQRVSNTVEKASIYLNWNCHMQFLSPCKMLGFLDYRSKRNMDSYFKELLWPTLQVLDILLSRHCGHLPLAIPTQQESCTIAGRTAQFRSKF